MPTDPRPHLRHKRPELHLGEGEQQELSELLRLESPDQVDTFVVAAEAAVFNYWGAFIVSDVVRPGNQLAAISEFRNRLGAAVKSYERIREFYESLDPITRTSLQDGCADDLAGVLGELRDISLTESEKADQMEAVIAGGYPEPATDTQERLEPAYIAATNRLLQHAEQDLHEIAYYRPGASSRQRRSESARDTLIRQLAQVFQESVDWSAFAELSDAEWSDESWEHPSRAEYRDKLIRSIRLVLDNANIEYPADTTLLELLPSELKRPRSGDA